jgi:uncharacterized hydrophobic protein (TIGR00271 family)
MSVLVVVTTPEEAGPLVRWGARFARSRDTSLRVLHLSRADTPSEPSQLKLKDEKDSDPVRAAVREAVNESFVQRFTVHFDQRKTVRIRELLEEAERQREESAKLRKLDPEKKSAERPVARSAEKFDESLAALREEGFMTLRSVADPEPVEAVLRELRVGKASLLVVGKHERRPGQSALDPGPRLMEVAPCDTMLMRAGPESGRKCNRILIPAAGGPHSKVALKLAAGLAESDQCLFTPLYVGDDATGEAEAKEVGSQQLQRVLQSAKIKPDAPGMFPEVVLAASPAAGIQKAVTDVSHDLVLVGASNEGFIKRVLFGSVPEHLFTGRDATTVAVLRRSRPLADRAMERVEGWFRTWLPQLERADRVTLFKRLQDGSRFNVDFAALIALSTGIAALGLIQNSPAVVIGAMLVAPLMTPMIGAGLALIQGNTVLTTQAFAAITKGFFLALAIGALMGFGARAIGMLDPGQLTPELLARGAPNVLDLVVAYLSGLAAAYALARPSLSGALPGVAIAAALVPPIGTVGIALATGTWEIASGAALLFGTNLVAIVLGAASVFRVMGVQARSGQAQTRLWTRRVLVALLFVTMTLAGWFVTQLPLLVNRNAEAPVVLTTNLAKALREEVEKDSQHSFILASAPAGRRLDVVVASQGPPAPLLRERLDLCARRILGRQVTLRLVILAPRSVAEIGSGS